MSPRRTIRTGVAVALAVASLAACTDDGERSSATSTTAVDPAEAFAEEVVARCVAHSAVIEETEPTSDPFAADATEEDRRANAEWVATFASEFRVLANDISEMEVPPGSEEAAIEMYEALWVFAAAMDDLADKVAAGTVTEADTGQAFRHLATADAAAASLQIPGGLSTCGQEPDEVAPGAEVVEVTAVEYGFRMGTEVVPPGPTAFVLLNEGEEIHELVLLRALEPNGILLALKAEAEGADPSVHAEVLGETSAGPGLRGVLNVANLEPGEYGLVCYIPGPDGEPHVWKGMVTGLTVT